MLATLVGLGVALTSASAPIEPQQVDSAMTGTWTGTAVIFVNWTRQKGLPVSLTIHADGVVDGTIGDAKLVNGTFRPNRGPVGRALHVKTDWIGDGELEGLIVAADSIRRDAVHVPLNWDGESFRGAVHSSGSMFGGKEHMVLTAGRLVLRRVSGVG